MVFAIFTFKQKKWYILTAIVCVCAVTGGVLLHSFFAKFPAAENQTAAMGTVISVKLFGNAETEHFSALHKIFDEIEQASSLTIPGSALSAFNSTGYTENTILLEQAKICQEVYKASGGAFDGTIYPVSALWGIGTPQARIPEEKELLEALSLVNGGAMQINDNSVQLQKGQKADFGAVGKGYACDAALTYLQKTDIPGAVIAVGGSILLYGKNAPTGADFTIAVRDPLGPQNSYAGMISLKNGFISTSGNYERFFEADGVRYHHILDPKTGRPAETELCSVTVVTKQSGALCDALSTACFVLGLEEGVQLLNKFSAQGIFIAKNGAVYVTDGLREAFTLTAPHFFMGELP